MINSTINPSAEMVNGKVELYLGSTLLEVCTCDDVLQDFTVERVEENSKFFGFGVCQKTNINLIDIDRVTNITTENSFKNYFGVDGEFISPYPTFYVTEVNRDENTNSISVTAYDILYSASGRTVADLELPEGFTARQMAEAIASTIGASGVLVEGVGAAETCFELSNANFDGTENLRAALNAIAEITQTIYYINNQEQLVFKRLSISGEPVVTITADEYYMLDSKTNRRLSAITHATELGNNVEASLPESGTTQYIRNNPFWELEEDIATLVESALAVAGGLTINQFSMNWGGNFLLEIGDRIAIETEDGVVYSYILNDVVRFLGYVDEDTQWLYEDNDNETAANPSTIGEAIKQTSAKVDKVNKEITLVVTETESNRSDITQLQLTTTNINAYVERVEQIAEEGLDSASADIETLKTRVDATLTADEVNLAFQKERERGADKVITATGFTFNDEGLTVSKNNSDISTQITEDGMSITRGEEGEVLTVNNQGVHAENLKATTYLIINETSRFEDWTNENGEVRTACFWIGG
jgi:hypothetical protein